MPDRTWPPHIVGDRYVLGRSIGQGGMGMVWEAEDGVLRRSVAVKLIRMGVDANRTARDRFIREARAAARLAHPNVVTVHDFGFSDDVAFMVMERLDGRDLEAVVLRSGALPISEALDLVEQAASGLAAAHAAGILHRDIKPANLMLTTGGVIKILDFGVARFTEDSPHLTSTDQLVGTVSYVAPERVQGQPASIHSDLYSLGCVLFTLLTGRPPYVGSPVEVLVKHLDGVPVAPSTRRADVPPALDQFVLRLLSKTPEDRPASANEVVASIRALKPATVAHSAVTPCTDPQTEGSGYLGAPGGLPASPPGPPSWAGSWTGRIEALGEPTGGETIGGPRDVTWLGATRRASFAFRRRQPLSARFSTRRWLFGSGALAAIIIGALIISGTFAARALDSVPGGGDSQTLRETPAAGDTADGFTCWSGERAASLSLCDSPVGIDGLAYVFPSFKAMQSTCQQAPTTRGVRFECPLGERGLIRYRFWDTAEDNRGHYKSDYAPYEPTEFRLDGETVGTTYRWPKVWEGRTYRMSALYGDDHFSVSVEAPSQAEREQLFKDIWFRSPSDFNGFPSGRGPRIAKN